MSSEIVKCVSCNIVINELLCFVQNKIDIMDEESLIRLCTSTFNKTEINTAKSLLFESISTSTRKISRRKNKEQKDVEDIIAVLKNTDPDKTPIFVARLLEKLPPISFDHVDVSALLKDILVLKQDVLNLKQSSVTIDQINGMKADIDHMKFASLLDAERPICVNKKRGGYLVEEGRDSGPIGIMNLSNTFDDAESTPKNMGNAIEKVHKWRSPTIPQNHQAASSCNSAVSLARCPSTADIATVNAGKSDNVTQQRQMTGGSGVRDALTVNTVTHNLPSPVNRFTTRMQAAETCDNASADGLYSCVIMNDNNIDSEKSLAEITRNGVWKLESPNPSVVCGKAAFLPQDKFKPATLKIPLFLSNVHKDTSEDDIVEYVLAKTKVKVVLHKIKMKIQKEYNAYKLMVYNENLDKFLSDELWPAGVTCRRFRPYKNLKADNKEIN